MYLIFPILKVFFLFDMLIKEKCVKYGNMLESIRERRHFELDNSKRKERGSTK